MVILMRTNTAYSDAVTWENEGLLFAVICYISWTMCKAVCIWTACTDCATSPNVCCSLWVCPDKHPRLRTDQGEKRSKRMWDPHVFLCSTNANAYGMTASASGPIEAQVCVSDVPENICGFKKPDVEPVDRRSDIQFSDQKEWQHRHLIPKTPNAEPQTSSNPQNSALRHC